mgnify:FL=1
MSKEKVFNVQLYDKNFKYNYDVMNEIVNNLIFSSPSKLTVETKYKELTDGNVLDIIESIDDVIDYFRNEDSWKIVGNKHSLDKEYSDKKYGDIYIRLEHINDENEDDTKFLYDEGILTYSEDTESYVDKNDNWIYLDCVKVLVFKKDKDNNFELISKSYIYSIFCVIFENTDKELVDLKLKYELGIRDNILTHILEQYKFDDMENYMENLSELLNNIVLSLDISKTIVYKYEKIKEELKLDSNGTNVSVELTDYSDQKNNIDNKYLETIYLRNSEFLSFIEKIKKSD